MLNTTLLVVVIIELAVLIVLVCRQHQELINFIDAIGEMLGETLEED